MYNLDSPVAANQAPGQEFSPPRTSTPLGSCNGSAKAKKNASSMADHNEKLIPNKNHISKDSMRKENGSAIKQNNLRHGVDDTRSTKSK